MINGVLKELIEVHSKKVRLTFKDSGGTGQNFESLS